METDKVKREERGGEKGLKAVASQRGEGREEKKKKSEINKPGCTVPWAGSRGVHEEPGRRQSKQAPHSAGRSTTRGSGGNSDGEVFSKDRSRGLSSGRQGVEESKRRSGRAAHEEETELAGQCGGEEKVPRSGRGRARAAWNEELVESDGSHESDSEDDLSGVEDVVEDEESTHGEESGGEEEESPEEEEEEAAPSEDSSGDCRDIGVEEEQEAEEARARRVEPRNNRGSAQTSVASLSRTSRTASSWSSSPSPGVDGERERLRARPDSRSRRSMLTGSGLVEETEKESTQDSAQSLPSARGVAGRRLKKKSAEEEEEEGGGRHATRDGGRRREEAQEARGGGKTRLRRFERLLEVPNPNERPDDLLSDDDEEENRIGNVPLWWYEKYDHIGMCFSGSAHELVLLFPSPAFTACSG